MDLYQSSSNTYDLHAHGFINSLLQACLCQQCKDLSTFCVPCIIGNNKFENAMLDLGASINLMPLSIFKSLSLGPLQPTGVVIQLANQSVAHPVGLVDDVLVRVGKLIFLADFYILDM